MTVLQFLRSHTPLLVKSKTLPGVATSMCTVYENRTMSSLREVPPVLTMTCTFMCLPSSLHTCDVCSASSLVGTSTRTWMHVRVVSVFSNEGMRKEAVFPVPFLARAKMSRPARATGMASSWIGDGFSKPFSKMPMSSSRLR